MKKSPLFYKYINHKNYKIPELHNFVLERYIEISKLYTLYIKELNVINLILNK